jgi:hypothetical protein
LSANVILIALPSPGVVENSVTTAGSAGTPLDAANAPGGDGFTLVTSRKRRTSRAKDSGFAVNDVQRSNANPGKQTNSEY